MNKLLIIEDDVTIRNALRILLENQGYTVVEATNGEEGLELFDKTFDLLIIDIMMPNLLKPIKWKPFLPEGTIIL